MQFLTENTDFTVIGVIGSPSVGKSTIMNQLYGFDPSSPGNNSFYFLCSTHMCDYYFYLFIFNLFLVSVLHC